MTNNKNTKINTKLITRHQISQDALIAFCKNRANDTLLGYTQTFKLSPTDHKPISKQIEYKIIDLFLPLKSCTDFIIFPEVHTNGGKKYGAIHFHGIISVNNNYQWFNKCIPYLRTLGNVLIKPIFELTRWHTYLLKDYATFIKVRLENYLITNNTHKKKLNAREYIKII